MSTASDKFTKAHAGLVLDQPFFGALALKLQIVEDPTCDTMWTNGVMLGYGPKFVDSLSLAQLKSCIAHEVMHCAMLHHVRMQGRDAKKWNYAGDYVINAILDKAGFDMPSFVLLDPQYAAFSTEHVYSLLPDMPPDSGDGEGSSSDPGGMGEVRQAPGNTNAQMKEQEIDWQVATNQAARGAKAMGKLPSALESLIIGMNKSKVDWKELLRNFITKVCKDDYTWSRPNRRFVAQNLYLPSQHGESMGEIIVVVDTSGSIGQDELSQFCSELNAITEDVLPQKIHVLYVDTRVAGAEEFTPEDLPIKMSAKGGGGTSFRPPFEWAEKQQIEPECLIYLTDMCCNDFPKEPPAYPVMWISTTSHETAPFGEVVRMS